MSIYVYGYTLADAPHDLEGLTGVDDRNVFLMTCDGVSAIVSSYEKSKLLVRGKDIFAHQSVLRHLMDEASIIPLHFGLTLQSLSKVEKVITANLDYLKRELNRIYNKVEMEISMRFDVDDIFNYMVEQYPYLRQERAKVFNGRLVYYLGNRVKKCEKFEKALDKERLIHANKAEEIIAPWCAEFKRARIALGECDVATFQCLVNRERIKVFERSIYEAGDLLAPNFHFSYNGPWAPQNFCDLSGVCYV